MPHPTERRSRAARILSRFVAAPCPRAAAILSLLSAGLSACAAPPPPQPHAHDPLTWSAAIGRLDDDRVDSSCSATLVAPDVIATAAHCVVLDGHAVDATELTFYPNLGAAPLPPAKGVRIIALGEDKRRSDRAEDIDVAADWALVQIAPSITGVAPIPLAKFTVGDLDRALAQGGELSQAGYGVYGLTLGQHLYQQGHCQRLDTDKVPSDKRDYVLFTSCRPIKGDSGGPLMLTKSNGDRVLVGVISAYEFTGQSSGRITIAASSLGFESRLAGLR
jgi:V8-like Glu-specific endopeptidase